MQELSEILKSVKELPKSMQKQFILRMNKELEESVASNAEILEIRKENQAKGKFTCPHCSSEEIIGHGNYKGGKRYKCNNCKRTFNDLTGTSISHIQKKEALRFYFTCIAKGLSLRKSAEEVKISFRTSFMWRHKIMGAFKAIGCTKLEGIIESDETFFYILKKEISK